MIRMSALSITCLCMLAVPGKTAAENFHGSVGFDRNDRVFTWKTGNTGSYTFSDRAKVDINNMLSTSLNRTTGQAEDRWYDTVNNAAAFTYKLTDTADVNISADEEWSRDTMSRFGESLLTTTYDGGFNYHPMESLTVTSNVGHIYDSRFENRDSGFRWQGGLNYRERFLDDLDVEFSGRGERSNLKRFTRNELISSRISYGVRDVAVRLAFTDNSNRRGYFSDIDRAAIESRERNQRTLQLALARGSLDRLTGKAAFEVSADFGKKNIFDSANDNPKSSKYQNNAHGLVQGVNLRVGRSFFERIGLLWGMEYAWDKNGVERLNRRRTQTNVATDGMVSFGIGATDSVRFEGWIKRTRIDTPAGVANDRDELKIESGVMYMRSFSESFKTALDFRVLQTHYVNIDVSQSSQNKWMKTFLLSPSVTFSPVKNIAVSHAVNVYANYISYDFDTDYAPRSNISRRVSSETWVDAVLSGRTRFRAGFMFEDNEYARLTTAAKKIPAEAGIKRFGDLGLQYTFTDWLVAKPHYIYAIRHDRDVAGSGNKTIRREVDQTFGLDCELFGGESGGLTLGLKRIVRTTVRYPVRIRDYITMTMRYEF